MHFSIFSSFNAALSVIAVLILTGCESPSTAVKLTATDSLTAQLDSIQKRGDIVGFSVSMVNNNGVIYSKGFGLSNQSTKAPYTHKTLQHIASVSKTFIGIALMKAVELGHLQLDDSIQKYLSYPVINTNFPETPITIRQLATHTSSIDDGEGYLKYAYILEPNQDTSKIDISFPEQRFNSPDMDLPMDYFLENLLYKIQEHLPGTHYTKNKPGNTHNYTNLGSALAAQIITNASGESFTTFTQKHIFDPLKMNATGWKLADIDTSMHSKLHRGDLSELPRYHVITYPDGNLISSSDDIGKYLSELIKGYSHEGTLLTKASYDELFRFQLTQAHSAEQNADHPYNGDYRPGIFMGQSALGYFGHAGGDAGVATWMFFDSKTKTGRYLVVNTYLDSPELQTEFFDIWDTMDNYLPRVNPPQSPSIP